MVAEWVKGNTGTPSRSQTLRNWHSASLNHDYSISFYSYSVFLYILVLFSWSTVISFQISYPQPPLFNSCIVHPLRSTCMLIRNYQGIWNTECYSYSSIGCNHTMAIVTFYSVASAAFLHRKSTCICFVVVSWPAWVEMDTGDRGDGERCLMFNGWAPNCPGLALSAQASAALRLPPPRCPSPPESRGKWRKTRKPRQTNILWEGK